MKRALVSALLVLCFITGPVASLRERATVTPGIKHRERRLKFDNPTSTTGDPCDDQMLLIIYAYLCVYGDACIAPCTELND